MASPGRPKVGKGQRKRTVGISFDPNTLDRIDSVAAMHGVSRSQIIHDSFRTFEGAMSKTLQEQRGVIREMQMKIANQEFLISELKQENESLKDLQGRAESILNPLRETDSLSKKDKETRRIMKAILHGQKQGKDFFGEVKALAQGRAKRPTVPILQDAMNLFGSWEALHAALQVQEAS